MDRSEGGCSPSACVDVALQVFGKPCQTALSLLSLLRHCGQWIHRIFLVVENARPKFDDLAVTVLADLDPRMETVLLSGWLGMDAADMSRMREDGYRQSVRYQYAWERTGMDYLLVIHNDVVFTGDVIAPMLPLLREHIAIGPVGQCWNCPACREHIVTALDINGGRACRRERYDDFSLSFADLDAMYRFARRRGEHIRDFLKHPWAAEFRKKPWPLPECRVNEWCCLVNMRVARGKTVPFGVARPFGAAASHADTAVAWFRDVNQLGERARHFDIRPFVTHSSGFTLLWDEGAYRAREADAARMLREEYPEHVAALMARGLPL